jgi:uncharacterized protein (UPF0264 family)
VSVRNAAEAIEAIAGGADVIDVKEPNHGALGAADGETIAEVVRAVGGRVPVTAAMGELSDFANGARPSNEVTIPNGVSLFKIGLANCRELANWQAHWQHQVDRLSPSRSLARAVAVVYADWRAAHAPAPQDVLALAVDFDCPALLIDTWNKAAGNLFDYWPSAQLGTFVKCVQSRHVAVVLAGSLDGPTFEQALHLCPDLVAVRTAACEGGRNGTVRAGRVRALQLGAAAVTR